MNPLSSGSLSTGASSPMLDVVGIGSKDRPSGSKEVEEVGTEFESVFLSMMLKEMRNSLDGGGFFGEESSDTFGGMFDLFIGKHLAQTRPLGIGNLLLDQYEKIGASGPDDKTAPSVTTPPTSFTA
ncbi:MAG: rod-binding protein [Pirellulaceae bacterium]